jgi:hypothetical protein
MIMGHYSRDDFTSRGGGDDAFFAAVESVEQEDQAVPLDALSEELLKALPKTMSGQMAKILRLSATERQQASPLDYSLASREIALRALSVSSQVCTSAGLVIECLADLTCPSAIAALEAPLGVRWRSNTISMLFAVICRMNLICYGSCNGLVAERRDLHGAGQTRDLSARVFAPRDYLHGAVALGRVADLLEAGKHRRATTMRRGAALLGMASIVHARSGEYARLSVKDVKPLYFDDGDECLSVTITMTKTNNSRIVNIDDPEVIQLLEPLRQAHADEPFFRSSTGLRLPTTEITHMLQQLGMLVVGQPASANILRKSATIGHKTLEERSVDLGQSDGSLTAEEYYLPDMRSVGKEALAATNEHARRRVAKRRLEAKKSEGSHWR